MKNSFLLATILSVIGMPALAGEPCRSAKDFVNLAQSFYGDNPELTNIITPEVGMSLEGLNGHPAPSHMLYRHEGIEHRLDVIDGEVTGLEAAAKWSKDGELCRLIDGEMAPAVDEDSTVASMNFAFPYKRVDGVFSIDEIREGAKDGSKVMNALAPGGLGFAVPGLRAIVLHPAEGSEDVPVLLFSRKGAPVSVPVSNYGSKQLIRLKDIKSAKADMLKIEGKYLLAARFKFDPDEIAVAEAIRLAQDAETEN